MYETDESHNPLKYVNKSRIRKLDENDDIHICENKMISSFLATKKMCEATK